MLTQRPVDGKTDNIQCTNTMHKVGELMQL